LDSHAALRGTTIVAVRRDGQLAMAGDGQVTLSDSIVKASARKVRRIFRDRVLAGFAGSVADSITLLERCEQKLDESGGNLQRAVHSLARDWRTDRALRKLEAMLLVGDGEGLYLVSGQGDVLRPEEDIASIGSGSGYALAAARALAAHTEKPAAEIATEAIRIAASICIYTNDQIHTEIL
jgi:ATP-dependent HslUV protease, peptidase subunit HslV